MSSVFKIAKQIDAGIVCERYLGPPPGRSKLRFCPFHTERTPSFGHKNGKFKCFGCSWYGDSIDLVAKLYGISLKEAAQTICEDFGLPIPGDESGPEAKKRIQAAQRKREQRRIFKQWKDAAIKGLNVIHRNATNAVHKGEHLKNPELAYVESKTTYYLDILLYGDTNEQIDLLRRGEIDGVEIY